MAAERLSDKKILASNLGQFVEGQMALYRRQLTIRNLADEAKFNEAVLTDNLSLKAQLEWRKDQKKRIGKDDPEERRRIRKEVSVLKDRIEQQSFSDGYLEQLTTFESGLASVDSVIQWLEERKATNTDILIGRTISEELFKKKAEKFEITKKVIMNETEFALRDGSIDTINTHMEKVQGELSKSLLSGNEELSSVYKLQMQSLQKALDENTIKKTIMGFATATMTGYQSATNLLNSYSDQMTSSATTGNITVGGNQFGSAREYWLYQRNSFINGSGTDGFFPQFEQELSNEVNIAFSEGTFERDTLVGINSKYDQLRNTEALKGFEVKIDASRNGIIQGATTKLAKKIVTDYKLNLNLNTALSKLNDLKGFANVEAEIATVTLLGSNTKQDQVDSILSTVNDILKNNPGITAQQAIDQAIKTGAGVVLSPNQLTSNPTEKVTGDLAKGAASGAFGPDNKKLTTAPGDVPANTPSIVPGQDQPQGGQPQVPQQFVIDSQLDPGASGASVKELQKFLNAAGYQVASKGAGSSGNETDFFGPLTQAALQKFQKAQGIVQEGDPQSTGFGRLGPQTLTAIKGFQF